MAEQMHWTTPEYARIRSTLLPHATHLASQAPNARYGAGDILDAGLALCAGNKFVDPTFRSLRNRGVRVMTRQRYLQILGGATPDEMLETGGDILEASVIPVVNSGRLKGPIKVAVDEHLIPYHGSGSQYKGGKKKSGTNKFEGYITAQAVARRPSATFTAYPIANGEAQSHYLGGLIENVQREGIDIDVMLLDRGFNSVANILEMIRLGVRFVTPLSGNTKLYDIMEEVDSGTGLAVRPYTMKNDKGESVTAILVIVRKTDKKVKKDKKGKKDTKGTKGGPAKIQDKYVAFLTNVELDSSKKLLRYIPKTYRVRWGIETGYRVLEGARARTKSPRVAARLFLFFLSLAFYNFWSLCREEHAIWCGKAVPMPMHDYADGLWRYIEGRGRPP